MTDGFFNISLIHYFCTEMTTRHTILMQVVRRKVATFILLISFTVAAFATLGDGRVKTAKSNKSLLGNHSVQILRNGFSLKSGYNYRGSNVIDPSEENNNTYINLNAVTTLQKGNRTYILPIKSKVLLVNSVKLSAGIPQMNQ